MPISDLQLLEIEVEALWTHDRDGRIRHVNEPGGELGPRFFFGRTAEGNLWRMRYDLFPDTIQKLEALAAEEPVHSDFRAAPRNLAAMLAVLREDQEIPSVYFGPTYRFPDELPRAGDTTTIMQPNLHVLSGMGPDWDDVAAHFEARQPIVAVLEEGFAVSVCFSSRLTDRAAEAGVETLEAFRGRGYGGRVVAQWARAVRASTRIPFYSTSWDNTASQGLARSLGLIQYGSELSLL